MADPRVPILASVAKRQAGIDPAVGDVYLRDAEVLVVTGRRDGGVAYRIADGQDGVGTLHEFRERAVDPVDLAGTPLPYAELAWQIASSPGIPRDVRVATLQKMLRRAPSTEDRLTVTAWARTLSAGMEPTR